jgi:hypothetical protein
MNNIQLQQAIDAYGWTNDTHYRVRRHVRFDGWNPRINEVIREMFALRLRYKKEGNPLQLVYKLAMNASYGKTILKPSPTKTVILPTGPFAEAFIAKKRHNIADSASVGRHTFFRCHVAVGTHKNAAHVGSFILAQSKKIMNAVIAAGIAAGVPILYTDTDSLIIAADHIGKFAAMSTLDGQPLIGTAMGQFHSDLASDRIAGEIRGTRGIFVGKKAYIIVLEGSDKDGNPVVDDQTHVRLKGVPNSAIVAAAAEMGTTNVGVFEKLYAGEMVGFDLLAGGRAKFKYDAARTVANVSQFVRRVAFASVDGAQKMAVEPNDFENLD